MRTPIARLLKFRARPGAAPAAPAAPPPSPGEEVFAANLRLLHDTLAGTDLAGRYWVWGGLLIGWAREGRPLSHDTQDADFCLHERDVPALARAAPALRAAGFAPALRFCTNAGRATEYCFRKDAAKFEFFVMHPAGAMLEYYEYADGAHPLAPDPIQARARIPDQPLAPFELVGRTWAKHADHDAELTAMYGDWRTPNAAWWYLDDVAIVERVPWTRGAGIAWDGDFGDPPAPASGAQ